MLKRRYVLPDSAYSKLASRDSNPAESTARLPKGAARPQTGEINVRRRFLIVLFLLLTLPAPSNFATGTSGDREAPDFILPTRHAPRDRKIEEHDYAGTVSLHDLRGKVVLVDFWASWCAPCRQSFPWMSSMSERYAAKGLVIVAINLDKTRAAADLFLEKFPATFAVGFDPAGKTAEAFHVEAMPSSFIVSRTGKIVYSHAGFQQSNTRAVEEQIKEELTK